MSILVNKELPLVGCILTPDKRAEYSPAISAFAYSSEHIMGTSHGSVDFRSYKLLPSSPNTSVFVWKIDMGSHLMQRLNALPMHFPFFLLWLQNSPVIISLLSQVLHYLLYSTFPRGKKNAPFWLKSRWRVCPFSFIFGTISPLTIQGLSYFFKSLDNNILFRVPLWIMTIIFTAAGLIFHIAARRLLAGEIDNLKHRMIKKSKLEIPERMYAKKLALPDSIEYNPLDYIDLKKVFLLA